MICHERGDDSSWDGAHVEDYQHPEVELQVMLFGELLDEEVGDVLAYETEESGEVH